MESNDNKQEYESRVVDDSTTTHNKATNINAIIGFGLSLTSLVIDEIYVLFAAGGLIFSMIGLSEIRARREKGKVLAICGLVISIIVFLTIILYQILLQLDIPMDY